LPTTDFLGGDGANRPVAPLWLRCILVRTHYGFAWVEAFPHGVELTQRDMQHVGIGQLLV
jgi:hypothetical protein